jgi:hypothetical protein
MKRVLISPLLIFTCITVLAQNECRTAEYRQQLINRYPALLSKIAAIEAFTQNIQKNKSTTINGSGSSVGQVTNEITIPVVVHVVYNTSQQNISDQQIISQINVLNQDYNRLNADTNNTAPVFRPYAANCGIHFELAKVDTAGYATSGIVRKHTSIIAFTIDDRIKSSANGGDDAWDKDRYLNIWVGNLNAGVLGYSSVVGGPKEDDGVVVMFNAFGVNGSAAAPFNKGRTATHEIGHWLNLIHTWGDADCGDDKVADTPPQQTADRGCPSGVLISCNNGPNGDMYSNYMDFVNDDCMNIFTEGQRDRMLALFASGGERFPLLSSNVLTATPIGGPVPSNGEGGYNPITIYPNPATTFATIQLNDSDVGSSLEVINQFGQRIFVTPVNQSLMQINVSSFAKGIYYVKICTGKKGEIAKLVKM